MDDTQQNTAAEQPVGKGNGQKIIIGVIAALVVVGAFIVMSQRPTKVAVGTDCQKSTESAVTIIYDGAGFSPKCLTVAKGTTITWDNQSASELQVGVDPHPSHSGDRAISNGEFVFKVAAKSQGSEVISKPGAYGYHNHLNSSAKGTLNVE